MKRLYLYISAAVVVGVVLVFVFMRKSPVALAPQSSLQSTSSPEPTPQAKPKPKATLTPSPQASTLDQVIYGKRKVQSETVISQFTSTTPLSEKFIWYQALARADVGLKDYQGAKAAYLLCLQSDPQNPLVAGTEAEFSGILVLMKDYVQALVYIQKAVVLRPDVPDYWQAYIAIETDYFHSSDLDIRTLYQQAIQKSNNHFTLIEAYAAYLEQKNDFAGALTQWQTLLGLYPQNQEAPSNISRLELIVH